MGGFKINVIGTFYNIKTNFFIEITTGDVITPREINYEYNSIFENKKINIMAYTIETIIAEKFESIISKNVINTRAKDFYDLYMIMNNYNVEEENLVNAIKNTFNKRNTIFDIREINEIVEMIENSQIIYKVFLNYQERLIYAKNIEFKDTIDALKKIINILEKNLIDV